MNELRVDINNKIATYNTRCGVIVCGNANYKIKFTFDEEWDEFEYKTARFIWNDKYIDVVFYGDIVAVPMLSQTTLLTVGVFAGENLHTTTPAKIPCLLSVICESDRAKEADYYEVNGTLEYRLPAIRPEDHSKILQAVDGKYELREAPDLTMNEGMVSAALETKVKPVQDKVKELETEIDEVKTNFGGEALRDDINELNSIAQTLVEKVETNEADLEQLNKLPAIIFENLTEADFEELAKQLNTSDKTLIGAINELNDGVVSLNKSRTQYDAEKKMLYIPIAVSKFEVEIGGLYIDWQHLKIYLEILGTTYDITDWEVVQEILAWIQDFGEKAVVWINGVGETIKDVINTLCRALWIPEPFPEGAEPNEGAGDQAGNALAEVIAQTQQRPSAAWKLKDKFEKTDLFEYTFDFASNGRVYNKMRSKINTNEYGNQTYLIHYIYYENGIEKFTTAYSSNKSAGWMNPEYQTVYPSNTSDVAAAESAAMLSNIAGAPWKLNEKLNPSIRDFEIDCDFITKGIKDSSIDVTYSKIKVKLAWRNDAHDPETDFDCIEYVRKEDGISEAVYMYNPHSNTGGWMDSVTKEFNNPQSVYRNILVLAPTSDIRSKLSKIGAVATESLGTTSQTYTGSINELFHNIGNLGDLQIEEVSKYSMRRSVEDEEETTERETLVKAINKVYRRAVTMEETIDKLDAKISAQINGNVWVIHQDLSKPLHESFTYNFKFTSNGRNFNKIHCDYWESTGAEPDEYSLWYCAADGTEENVCYFNGYTADWYGEEYRTIITDDDISLEHIAVLEKSKEDNDLSLYQTREDENLETESKEIVGAINEVNSKVGTSGTSDNAVLSYNIIVEASTTVVDMINTLKNMGADISKFNVVVLKGYQGGTFGLQIEHYGGNVYNIHAIDLMWGKTLNNTKEWSGVGIGTFVASFSREDTDTTNCFEMPQIRFANQAQLWIGEVSEDNPLKLTVEIVGGGALQVGDALQICRRKLYNYSKKDENGEVIETYSKRKLVRFAEYIVTEEDLDKRFLTLTITGAPDKEQFALSHNGRVDDMRHAQRFIRIRRPKGDLQNNDSGMTVDASFSNVVPIWWTYTNNVIRVQ